MLPLAAEYPLLEIVWTMLVFFGFVIWIGLMFRAFIDLFRRHDVSGWGKAAWTFLIVLVPLIGVFVYFCTQGHGMVERDAKAAQAAEKQFGEYVREVSGDDVATQIAKAKDLLDAGTIDQAEFEQMKRKALS